MNTKQSETNADTEFKHPDDIDLSKERTSAEWREILDSLVYLPDYRESIRYSHFSLACCHCGGAELREVGDKYNPTGSDARLRITYECRGCGFRGSRWIVTDGHEFVIEERLSGILVRGGDTQ